MAIVVLDPGHGGTAKVGGSSPNNAVGPTGLLEKNVTLEIAKLAAAALDTDDVDVFLTRSSDRNIGLVARAAVAKQKRADAFVSIHFNGFDGKAQGTETIVHTNGSADSKALARSVQTEVRAATGLKDRGVKLMGLGVLSPGAHASSTAACLVEVSFMDVPAEEQRLRQQSHLAAVADAISRGVHDWLISDGRVEAAFEDAGVNVEEGSVALAKPKRRKAVA